MRADDCGPHDCTSIDRLECRLLCLNVREIELVAFYILGLASMGTHQTSCRVPQFIAMERFTWGGLRHTRKATMYFAITAVATGPALTLIRRLVGAILLWEAVCYQAIAIA